MCVISCFHRDLIYVYVRMVCTYFENFVIMHRKFLTVYSEELGVAVTCTNL